MSSTAFIRSAPTSFRLVLPTGILSNTSQPAGGFAFGGTSTGNASSPAQAPLISGVGGAGLILVFVACALLFVILILAFIFRGLRGPRSRLESGGAPWDDFEASTTRPPPPALGEKPQMCDIHVSVQSMQRYAPQSTASWRNVQPLSASEVVDTITLPTLAKTKRASVSSVDSSYSQGSDSPSFIELDPPRNGIDLGNRSSCLHPSLDPMSPKPPNMRVAIPIVMPRQPSSTHTNRDAMNPHDVDFDLGVAPYFEHTHDTDGNEGGRVIPEFCLGIAEVRPAGRSTSEAGRKKER